MDTQHWAELQTRFRDALALPVDQREAYVASLDSSAEVRAQLQELLAAHEGSERLLEPADELSDELPERIGDFRILREVGCGGMGIVYEAEQANPRRTVALKTLRTDAASPSLLRRFEREAQVLARLQHPAIAQVYEAGSATCGRFTVPYFAMEFVHGEPLTRYARQRQLGIAERVELLARVADAVHHAHISSVIHRDLKPSNILVTAAGEPKVLDFGIARAASAELGLTTKHTELGQLVGTLPYMSPEQTHGAPEQLDTRSDVYSLGVLAFETLTGRLPHDVSRATPLEALRKIQEEEAARVSSFDPLLRGDLDTIVAKALEKDRDRRYSTAREFAEDLRRFLRDEPILARPATRIYQLSKFARRNRALSAAIVALLAVLLSATAVSTWLALQRKRALDETEQARGLAEKRREELELSEQALRDALERVTAARDEAERERAVAEAVRDFLAKDVLAQSDPTVRGERELTVVEALANAAERIDGRFSEHPSVEFALRRVLSSAYQHLRRPELALRHALRSVELVDAIDGPGSAKALAARRDVAVLQLDNGQAALAVPALERFLDEARRTLPDAHPERLRTMANLATGLYHLDDYARAAELLEEAIDLAQDSTEIGVVERTRWQVKLADAFQRLANYPRAKELLEQTLEQQRGVLGPDHPFCLLTANSLALVHMELFELQDAERISSDVLERSERVLGEQHLNTLSARAAFANILQRQGRFDEAYALHARTLAAQRLRGETAVADALSTQYSMASILQATQKFEAAEQLARETFDEQVARFGEHHYHCVLTLNLLGMVQKELGRLDEAVATFERMIELSRATFGEVDANTASGINNLASTYELMGRLDEASELYEEVGRLHVQIFGPLNATTLIGRGNFGGLLLRQKREAEAEPLLRETVDGLVQTLGAGHWLVGATRHKYALSLALLGRGEESVEQARQAHACLEAALGPDHQRTRDARGSLAQFQASIRKQEK